MAQNTRPQLLSVPSPVGAPISSSGDLRAWREEKGGFYARYPQQQFAVDPETGQVFDPSTGQLLPDLVFNPVTGAIDVSAEATSAGGLTELQLQRIEEAIKRKGHFVQFPFTVGAAIAIEILPQQQSRYYLLIQNTSGNTLFIGFDQAAQSATGLQIAPGLGAYEPLVVPDNSISVIGSAVATTGTVLYAV